MSGDDAWRKVADVAARRIAHGRATENDRVLLAWADEVRARWLLGFTYLLALRWGVLG